MSFISDQLNTLTKQLLPDGRAFKMPPDGVLEGMFGVMNEIKAVAYEDALSVLDSINPLSPDFNESDAEAWEAFYAIPTAAGTTLADRKAAILQRMRYPGDTSPRCAADYIQDQLRTAGFDVYVYENSFYVGSPVQHVTERPTDILGAGYGRAMYGAFMYGETEYGASWDDTGITLVMNHLEEGIDDTYPISEPYGYRSTFYVSGDPITTFADVPEIRKTELRQLLLQLKPANTIAILFVNYV